MKLDIIVLAKDEQENIVYIIEQIIQQSIFAQDNIRAELVIVANGCTDKTVEFAAKALEATADTSPIRSNIYDLSRAGKSNAWNFAVHDRDRPESNVSFFVDCDIEFTNNDVLLEMITALISQDSAVAIAGRPAKRNETKSKRNFVDRFSSRASKNTRWWPTICGQLYGVMTKEIQNIYLPSETPGEDGFINAMIKTTGFTVNENNSKIILADRPTHYFDDLNIREFVIHERRIIVGTIINNWIFEELWSLGGTLHAGVMIKMWNEDRPFWVREIIAKKIGRRTWVVNRRVLLRRFAGVHAKRVRDLLSISVATASTIACLPSAILANRALKRKGAASLW